MLLSGEKVQCVQLDTKEHIMNNTPHRTSEVCEATRKDGQRCHSRAGYNARYCFVHDPDRAALALAARSAGGQARSRPAPAEPISLRTVDDQIAAIEQTIDRVRAGQEPVSVARLALYGVSLARPLVELGEIEAR